MDVRSKLQTLETRFSGWLLYRLDVTVTALCHYRTQRTSQRNNDQQIA